MKYSIYSNLIIFSILLLSTIIVISSTNTFIIWISFELNIFSFIPLLLNKTNTNETEASILYFLSQSLGSRLFLIRRIIILTLHILIKLSYLLFILSILIKIGIAPCHFWLPITIKIISWINCFLLLTWQKIAPLFIILYITTIIKRNILITTISSINALVGGIIGLRQLSLKKIIAYSSITHIGWTLRGIVIKIPCLSVRYFIIYSIIILPLLIIFNKYNKNNLNDLWSIKKPDTWWTIIFSINILSLGGIPPLTGFIPKLLIISILLNNSVTITIMLIVGSLLNLFFYLNITLNIMIVNKNIIHKSKTILNLNIVNIVTALNFITAFFIALYALIILIKPQRHWNTLHNSCHLSRLCRNHNKNNYSHRTITTWIITRKRSTL